MAQWNLSVDLRGQGDDLARALRESAGLARTLASQVDAAQGQVRTLGGVSRATGQQVGRMGNQARAASRDLRSLAEQAQRAARQLQQIDRDIQVRVDFDDGNLATRSRAAARALDAVRDTAREVSRALLTLAARARIAARNLDELRDSARSLNTALSGLNTRTRSLDGRLDSLSTRTRTLRTDMDDLDGSLTRVNGRMGGLRGNLGTLGNAASNTTGRTRLLIQGAIALGTALIPIAASLAPIAAGMAAAGAGVTAFGLAVGGQIAAMAEASEAQEKYDKAVREHGQHSAEAAEAQMQYQRLIADMPPETRQAAAALGVLKDEYEDWTGALSADTMPVVTKSLQLFTAALPKTTGLARTTSRELEHMLDVAGGALQTPGVDRLMATLEELSGEAIAKVTSGIVRMTTALDTGAVGSDLEEFLDYAREVGPQVADTLGSLARAALNLLVAASDMGVSVLTAVDALADLVAAIPPGALSVFIQTYAALKLVSLGMGMVGAAASSGAVARLGAYFAVMRAAGVSTTLRATAASMSAMSKATVGLGVLAIAALGINQLAKNARGAPPDVDKLTTSLKNLATTGKMTGELKATFGDFDGLVDKLKEFQKETDSAKKAQEGLFGFRIPGLDDASDWIAESVNDMAKGEKSLNALKEDFEGVDQALANLASSGSADQAAAGFDLLSKAGREAGLSAKEIKDLFPEYQSALAAAKVEQQLAAEGMGLFGQQAQDTSAKLDAQKASADGLRQAIQALNDTNRSALGGQIAFEQAIDAASKAAKKNADALTMRDGVLDLSTEKAQNAASSLKDLAGKTDEAAAAARESGASWETVSGIYDRGRDALISNAHAMGLSRSQATALADSILTIPDEKTTRVTMEREDALAGLDAVIAKIKATPGAKSVTVKALTRDAIAALEAAGYKVKTLPNGKVQVTALTGTAISNLYAVKAARDSLSDKTITITTHYRITGNQARRSGAHGSQLANADGSITDYYADGGIRGRTTQRGGVRSFAAGAENHVAQMAPAGSWRVWAEPETGGEAYIPLAPAKRPRSRAIAEETVRRLGGDPASIQWNANGDVTDWTYDPNTGTLYSAADAGRAGHKTKKVKVKGKGGKVTIKEVEYFDLGAVEKKLKSSAKAAKAFNADLATVTDRAGSDVAAALASMGADGVKLADKMAKGSKKYVDEMSKALLELQKTSKASLTDYTRALNENNKLDATFAKNLSTLAAQGYGDLAAQLAAQNDQAAMELAASAVKDKKKASAANKAAGTANNALDSSQVQQLVQVIAAIKTKTTGIHDVAATTGLGEDEIIDVGNKAKSQIKSALGSRADKFLADLTKANKGLAYAYGGIREGIYATAGGLVRFAEPSTRGEAYIPLAADRRARATNVLADVAGRFGLGLTDAKSARVVVIREQGPLVGATNYYIGGRGDARTVAREIESRQSYQLRRLARGGVGAQS